MSLSPDRITGWAYDGNQPERTLQLGLEIDGQIVDAIPADILRKDLDPAAHINRNVGFHTTIPYRFWDGETHEVALVEVETGQSLIRRRVETRDLRIPGGGAGEITEVGPRRVSGWVCAPEAVRIELDVDGLPAGGVDAPAADGREQAPFTVALPAAAFDDGVHDLALHVVTAEGRAPWATASRALSRADGPKVEGGLDPLVEGRLSGWVMDPDAPDALQTVALLVNGREAARADSVAAAAGPARFSFDLSAVTGVDWLTSAVTLRTVPDGVDLAFVDPDFVRSDALAMIRRRAGGDSTLSIVSSLPLPETLVASVEDQGAQIGVWTLNPGAGAYSVEAVIDGPPIGFVEPLVRLVSGEAAASPGAGHPLPTRLLAGDATAPRRRSGVQAVLGDYRAPNEPVVRARLAEFARGEATDSPSDAPHEFTGAWKRGPSGVIEGWAVDLYAPSSPLQFELLINGRVAHRGWSDAPVAPREASLPLVLPIGFRFDPASSIPEGGQAELDIRIGGYGRLQPATPAALEPRGVASPAVKTMAAAMTAFRRGEDVAPLARIVTADEGRLLRKVLLGRGDGRAPTGALGAAVLALARDVKFARDVVEPLIASEGVLPHFLQFAPPLASELRPLFDILPFGAETREELLAARNWTALLRRLFRELSLFADVLDPDRVEDLRVFQRLQAVETGAPAPELALETSAAGPARLIGAGLTDGAATVELFDAFDQMLASGPVRIDAGTAVLAFDPPTEPPARFAAIRTGKKGPWRAFPVRAVTAPAIPVIEVDDRVRVSGLSLSGRVIEATIEADEPPPVLIMKAGARSLRLEPVAEPGRYVGVRPAEEVGDLRLAGSEPADDGAAEYDLRLGADPLAARPSGLVARLVDDPASIHVGDVSVVAGRLTGWLIAGGAPAPTQVIVSLLPTAPPVIEGEEAVEPAPVLVRGAATGASEGAAAAYGAALSQSGFDVGLPVALLDGQSYDLVLSVRLADGPAPVWSGQVALDAETALAQIGQITVAARLSGFLTALAQAKRLDVLQVFYADPGRHSRVNLNESEHFGVLAAVMASNPEAAHVPHLAQLFDGLWRFAMTGGSRFHDFLDLSRIAVLGAEEARIRQRFPQSPLAEAAVDLVVATEKAGDGAERTNRRATDALALKRRALAGRILSKGLESHADHAGLRITAARRSLSLGAVEEARTHARRAAAAKPLKETDRIFSLALAHEGRHLEAVSIASGGRGVVQAAEKPVAYEVAQTGLALDWVKYLTDSAVAEDKPGFVDMMERAAGIHGTTPDLSQTTYSLFFVAADPRGQSIADQFEALGAACCQVGVLEDPNLSDAPCIGEWAVVFDRQISVSAEMLDAAFAQRRPYEAVLRLIRRSGAEADSVEFEQVGAIVRADMLRAFPDCDLPTFLERAEAALKVKTVIV